MDRKQRSIKQQIVFSFILLLIAIFGISGYFVYANWLDSAEQTTNTILESTGAQVYKQIDRFTDVPLSINSEHVVLIQHNLIDLADDYKRDLFFANQIKTAPDEVYSFTYGAENGYFFGARRNPQNEIEVYKNNAQTDGKNRYYKVKADLSTGEFVMETARFDPRSRDWYQIAKARKGPFFSPVYVHFVMNDLAFSAAEPVYGPNGQLLGVLGTHVTLSRLNNYLAGIVADNGGIVYIVESQSGELVANSGNVANFHPEGEGRIRRVKAAEIEKKELFEAYRGHIDNRIALTDNSQWFVKVTDYNKMGLEWRILVAIPKSPYMASLMNGIYYSLSVTIFTLLLGVFLYVKGTNIVLAPIHNLIQTTERFTAGEFGERAAVFRNDEIGVLSKAFNRMADEICELIDSLETKIKARTAQLEQLNQVAVQAQDQAQAASAAKGAFLANMSHELRTPLNAILGYSELMQNDAGLSRQNREYIGTIHRSGAHMLSLINDVLDIAKIESRTMSLRLGTFELAALVNEIESMLKVRADAKHLDFVVTGKAALPRYVTGDATKLRVVLLNLIGNAIKFTEQGRVTVSFTATPLPEGKVSVAVVVEDTGSGIPTEEQDKLFQFFSQTESGRLSQSGTGLGLAISQEYVRMMGGEIRLSSQSGLGSRFSFAITLEAKPVEPVAAKSERRRVIGLKPGRKIPRVLIAEDTAENRTLLLTQLSALGLEIFTADNGQEAVDQFWRHQPELIWMDIRMPVMDGCEAARIIKASPQGARTKIVALSAHAFGPEQQSLREAGFDGIVAKPYQASVLYQTMGELLELEYIYDVEADQRLDLPEGIRTELLAAVVKLDTEQITRIIHDLAPEYPVAAKLLAPLAANYEYSRMLQLIQLSGQDQVRGGDDFDR